ncbi:MAG: hypothetical protein O7C75_05835 [Verrucomicrobia bacterium]|nr:hypothetical protein [Verrucomicrobiota bacterium]
MDSIKDEFAFSFGPEGWNCYCALLKECAQYPAENVLEQSLFWRFYVHDKIRSVRTLNDLLFLHDAERRSSSAEFYLGTYPWGGLTETDTSNGGIPFGWYYDQVEGKQTRDLWTYGRNLWYEPGDRYTLECEWARTIKVYNSLKRNYRPLWYHNYPSVALLVRENSERLGLILDGHHRMGALSHLGYKQVRVALTEVVNETAVDQWYYVKNGYCTREQALVIFNAFFEVNGSERIEYLGLKTGEQG